MHTIMQNQTVLLVEQCGGSRITYQFATGKRNARELTTRQPMTYITLHHKLSPLNKQPCKREYFTISQQQNVGRC